MVLIARKPTIFFGDITYSKYLQINLKQVFPLSIQPNDLSRLSVGHGPKLLLRKSPTPTPEAVHWYD